MPYMKSIFYVVQLNELHILLKFLHLCEEFLLHFSPATCDFQGSPESQCCRCDPFKTNLFSLHTRALEFIGEYRADFL